MAQHGSNGGNDRHLTTEQLSALLDNQLPADEQATYEAHLNTCRQCQRAMANLRQTVALLHALPQPPLPRSFTLPASMGVAQDQMEQPEQLRQLRPVPALASRRRDRSDNRRAYAVRRTVRAISTIAAVIGLVFLLSSFVTSLPHGGGASSTTSSGTSNGGASSGTSMGTHQAQGATSPHYQTPVNQCASHAPTPGACHAATTGPTPTTTPVPLPTPTPTQTAGQNSPYDQTNQANAPPDLNSPQAHLAYGAVLLLIGLLGVALTRRKRD